MDLCTYDTDGMACSCDTCNKEFSSVAETPVKETINLVQEPDSYRHDICADYISPCDCRDCMDFLEEEMQLAYAGDESDDNCLSEDYCSCSQCDG